MLSLTSLSARVLALVVVTGAGWHSQGAGLGSRRPWQSWHDEFPGCHPWANSEACPLPLRSGRTSGVVCGGSRQGNGTGGSATAGPRLLCLLRPVPSPEPTRARGAAGLSPSQLLIRTVSGSALPPASCCRARSGTLVPGSPCGEPPEPKSCQLGKSRGLVPAGSVTS